LAELATEQFGVVATRQLAALGYSKSSVAKAAKVGRLHRIHRGVYVVGHRRLSWHGRCMAAVLTSYPSVASHLSAAWLWGIIRNRPGTIHVTCPVSRRARRPFVVHAAELAEVDRTIREGVPVTSVARTVLDLAVDGSARDTTRQIQRADDLKVFDLREMRALLARSNGHHGKAKVEAALGGYRPERVFTRSGLERRFLELMREAGLPEPAMNAFVAGYEIDAWWGSGTGRRAAPRRDRPPARVTGLRLDREPGVVVDSIRRHLARRAHIK
jgi:hypothetical protein